MRDFFDRKTILYKLLAINNSYFKDYGSEVVSATEKL